MFTDTARKSAAIDVSSSKCVAPEINLAGNKVVATDFSEVMEVKFSGAIGPLGIRRLCKIKCIGGEWVGPLCQVKDGELPSAQDKIKCPGSVRRAPENLYCEWANADSKKLAWIWLSLLLLRFSLAIFDSQSWYKSVDCKMRN